MHKIASSMMRIWHSWKVLIVSSLNGEVVGSSHVTNKIIKEDTVSAMENLAVRNTILENKARRPFKESLTVQFAKLS